MPAAGQAKARAAAAAAAAAARQQHRGLRCLAQNWPAAAAGRGAQALFAAPRAVALDKVACAPGSLTATCCSSCSAPRCDQVQLTCQRTAAAAAAASVPGAVHLHAGPWLLPVVLAQQASHAAGAQGGINARGPGFADVRMCARAWCGTFGPKGRHTGPGQGAENPWHMRLTAAGAAAAGCLFLRHSLSYKRRGQAARPGQAAGRPAGHQSRQAEQPPGNRRQPASQPPSPAGAGPAAGPAVF
jgi:hypothetical protein